MTMYPKILYIGLASGCMTAMAVPAVPVFAGSASLSATQTTEAEENTTIIDHETFGSTDSSDAVSSDSLFSSTSSVFDSYLYNTEIGSGNTLSETMSNALGMDISTEQLYDTDSFSACFDTGTLNEQYENLVSEMNSSKEAMTEYVDSSGTVMDVFNNAYGDLASSITLEQAEIPEGFSKSDMLESAQNAVTKAYQSAISSSDFQSVRNSISIGSIMSKAASAEKDGISAPSVSSSDLASDSTLKSLLSDTSSGAKEGYNNAVSSADEKLAETKKNVKDKSEEDFTIKQYQTVGEKVKNFITGKSDSEDSASESKSKSLTEKIKDAGKKIKGFITGN